MSDNVLQLQEKFVKHLIRDTIDTYSLQWRLIHEAVQNAADAIQQGSAPRGLIEVLLDLSEDEVCVTDNGTGVPASKYLSFFSLGASLKSDEALRKQLKGSQGVGIKATVFSSRRFEVITQTKTQRWQVEVRDFCEFMKDTFKPAVAEPTVEKAAGKPFTRVSYQLAGYTVADFLCELAEEYCETRELTQIDSLPIFEAMLERYFRMHTYLGCMHRRLGYGEQLKPIDVRVTVKSPGKKRVKMGQAQEIATILRRDGQFVTSFEGSYPDFKEEIGRTSPRTLIFEDLGAVIAAPPMSDKKTRIYIEKFVGDEVRNLIGSVKYDRATKTYSLEDPKPEVLKKYSSLLSKINGAYLVIGKRGLVRTKLDFVPEHAVAVNGLVTNIAMVNPTRGGELGYLPNVHLVIDLDTTLGYGKRNIPSRTKGQLDAFFAEAWRSTLMRAAKTMVGTIKTEGKKTPTSDWHYRDLIPRLEKKGNLVSPVVPNYPIEPVDEQDLLAIFHELIGLKLVGGYYFLGSSQFKTYDAAVYIDTTGKGLPKKVSASDIRNLEFKPKMCDLIQDFQTGVKSLGNCDVAVVWDARTSAADEEAGYFLEDIDLYTGTPFPHASYYLLYENSEVQIIELSSLMVELGAS